MKPKSYTFTHNPGNSVMNIPVEYFIDGDALQLGVFETDGYYINRTVYGFLIKKEILDKQCKSLYTLKNLENLTGGDIKGRRIAFVKFAPNSLNIRLSDGIERIASSNGWTVTTVIDNTSDWKKIPNDCYLLALKMHKSKSKILCFEKEDDAINEYNKRKEKKEANLQAKKALIDNAPNNGNISLSTPKYEVKAINIETDYLKGVKVGDIIYGSISVLNDGKNNLNTSSKYVNYIDLYVNDRLYKTLPMNVFGNLLATNIQLSIVD